MRKGFVQLFWGVSGTGELVIEGQACLVGPGQVALYYPGMMHRISSLDETWEYRWMTVDGSLAESIVAAFGLAPMVMDAGAVPVERFEALAEILQEPSLGGEIAGSALAYEFLAYAAQQRQTPERAPEVERALAIVRNEWADASLSVAGIAQTCGVHRSRLSRLFADSMGVTLVGYIRRVRMQQAMSLLRGTRLSIAEVARRCGFDDPNYFSRLMQREQGMSPRQFRREGGI
jgi:AraC-like DNA-binding protein